MQSMCRYALVPHPMKIILLLLLLTLPGFTQVARPGSTPFRNTEIPPGQTWTLGGETKVVYEERDGKRGLWFGDELLAALGNGEKAQENVYQSLEDGG